MTPPTLGQKAPAKAPVQALISRSSAGIICWDASWELAMGIGQVGTVG
jgi:hypothetical protein